MATAQLGRLSTAQLQETHSHKLQCEQYPLKLCKEEPTQLNSRALVLDSSGCSRKRKFLCALMWIIIIKGHFIVKWLFYTFFLKLGDSARFSSTYIKFWWQKWWTLIKPLLWTSTHLCTLHLLIHLILTTNL